MIDLSLVWAGIIAFGIFMYVVMDGFDLGIGILFPFFPNAKHRDVMMNTIAPVWDGNETWMVLGGAGLFAAFPLAYAIVLPALYMPLLIMVIALIFRGVAFEFRFKATQTKHLWDLAFSGGSIIAAFSQGLILGGYIQGIQVQDNRFAGGSFDWLTPFAVFSGLGVMVAYATLGCGWLIMKTSRDLQQAMFRLMPLLTMGLLLAYVLVSIWTPLEHPEIAKRWFSMPQLLYFMPVPLLVVGCAIGIERAVAKGSEATPFILTLVLVALGYIGFLISLWPHIIPPAITLWQAAAPSSSQSFTLVGALILLPLILTYTAFAYWVFRGKVHVDSEGYH
jgi:cytochrome d ubiquinol oxidase subunit II